MAVKGSQRFVVLGKKSFVEFFNFRIGIARGGQFIAETGHRFRHPAFTFTPETANFFGEFVTAEALTEQQTGFADDQFKEVELLLQNLQQVFLQSACLNKIVDMHWMLLSQAMQTANA